MDSWERYLFESHSEDTLRNWARRLHGFRFLRAYGGHASDVDSLEVAYRYRSPAELRDFFAFLGLELAVHARCPPHVRPGVAYTVEDYARLPSLIPGTRWIEQPGHRLIAGKRVFLWCTEEAIRISLGSDYVVSERDIADAEALEAVLAAAPLPRMDPPIDDRHCICPKYYPQFFDQAR